MQDYKAVLTVVGVFTNKYNEHRILVGDNSNKGNNERAKNKYRTTLYRMVWRAWTNWWCGGFGVEDLINVV